MYGSESWTLNKTLLNKLESFQAEVGKHILQLPKSTSNTSSSHSELANNVCLIFMQQDLIFLRICNDQEPTLTDIQRYSWPGTDIQRYSCFWCALIRKHGRMRLWDSALNHGVNSTRAGIAILICYHFCVNKSCISFPHGAHPVTNAAEEARVGRDTAIDAYQWLVHSNWCISVVSVPPIRLGNPG